MWKRNSLILFLSLIHIFWRSGSVFSVGDIGSHIIDACRKNTATRVPGPVSYTHLDVYKRQVTGSLLVCYDSCAVQPQLLQAAVMKLLGLEEAANESGGSLLGRECRTFAQSMNHAVAEKTGGRMDLNFLISILMMGVGMFRCV